MNGPFIIPVTYQGKEYEFKARFERWGYTHRIAVLVDEQTYNFEPDEEGSYRVLINPEHPLKSNPIATNLLQKIAEKLTQLTSN